MIFGIDQASGESQTVFVTVTSKLSNPFTVFVHEARVWDVDVYLAKLRERYPRMEVERVTEEQAEAIKRGHKAT